MAEATVSCPTCGKTVVWTPAARWRPFCSERCRLIDLGEWMSEGHRIPGENVDLPDEPNDDPDAPPGQDQR
jgi:endogenous inhibitor of DNA gyrase (YacG/DUF329 family)